ncbi:MAG: carboxypeptidase-like regulatory domain-containing protein [Spirosomataceae bacterium]
MKQLLQHVSIRLLVFMGSIALLTACNLPSNGEPGPGNAGKSGYLVGKVTDPQGKPLARATVYTDNTVIKGRGAEVTTASDGTYQVQIPKDLGQWVAKGYLLKQYNDRVYKILLDPENPNSFTAEENPVRHFQWKLTGHLPDLSLDLYYGGTAELFRDPNAVGLPDTDNIEFTFTPVGSLIDGSSGKTLKLQATKQDKNFLKDIPMGRYKITAVYKPTGEPLLVADARGDDFNYQPTVTLDFWGTESYSRANRMGIGFKPR